MTPDKHNSWKILYANIQCLVSNTNCSESFIYPIKCVDIPLGTALNNVSPLSNYINYYITQALQEF